LVLVILVAKHSRWYCLVRWPRSSEGTFNQSDWKLACRGRRCQLPRRLLKCCVKEGGVSLGCTTVADLAPYNFRSTRSGGRVNNSRHGQNEVAPKPAASYEAALWW